MTAINRLTHVRSMHTNVKDSSKHIRKYMSILCRKLFVHYTAHAHLQLQAFFSDIIWIISNEISLLEQGM
jgi:hypothetical protein